MSRAVAVQNNVKLSTDETMRALAAMYQGSPWAFLPQVRSATGWHRERTADAIAMSVWPSRGLHLYGFEVKVSRSDWLKELRTPEKADEICAFCDFWYVVVGDPWIVQQGELPPTWGLIVPAGKDKLFIKKEAPKLDPKPIDAPLLASILRNVARSMIHRSQITEQLNAAREEGKERALGDIDGVKYKLERAEKAIADFEAASGVRINEWNGDPVGAAVNLVLNSDLSGYRRHLESFAKRCGEMKTDLDAVIAEMDQAKALEQSA
jgi:hypothetical protein